MPGRKAIWGQFALNRYISSLKLGSKLVFQPVDVLVQPILWPATQQHNKNLLSQAISKDPPNAARFKRFCIELCLARMWLLQYIWDEWIKGRKLMEEDSFERKLMEENSFERDHGFCISNIDTD